MAKYIKDMTTNEAKNFFESFDTVCIDNDGVVVCGRNVIEGASAAINELRKCGKNINIVSNNSLFTTSTFCNNYKKMGIECNEDEFCIPTLSLLSYLKSINFNKKIYVISSPVMKSQLTEAGIKIIDDAFLYIETGTLIASLEKPLDEEVGAVLCALDINLNYFKLIRAYFYLKKPDVKLFVGAEDKYMPIGNNINIPAPYCFVDLLAKMANKEPVVFGKPTDIYKKFLYNKLQINDPKRVLFIGDMLDQDIGFAIKCGFRSMLVLSGISTVEDMNNCDNNKRPDYYADSLQDVYDLLVQIQSHRNASI